MNVEDTGGKTPSNRWTNSEPGLFPNVEEVDEHLPQLLISTLRNVKPVTEPDTNCY